MEGVSNARWQAHEEPSFPAAFQRTDAPVQAGNPAVDSGAHIEIIPEPLPVISAEREGDRSFVQVGVKWFYNVGRNIQHMVSELTVTNPRTA